MWITRDLGVVAGIADRVIVMYGGQIVEHAWWKICLSARHILTRARWNASGVDDTRADRLCQSPGSRPA